MTEARFKNLGVRVKTAIILGGMVSLALVFAAISPYGRWVLCAISFLAVLIAADEFSKICDSGEKLSFKRLVYFVALALPASSFILFLLINPGISQVRSGAALSGCEIKSILIGTLFSLILVFFYTALKAREELRYAEIISREAFLGIIHVGLFGAFLTAMPFKAGGIAALVWVLLVVITNDVAAYFVGSRFQGPKLCVPLSPGKTISGGVGALVGSLVVGLSLFSLFPGGYEKFGVFGAIALTLLTSIFAQSADLLKSFIKRLYNVKDSGTILPGHGGVLDRIDGLLAGAAVLYLGSFI